MLNSGTKYQSHQTMKRTAEKSTSERPAPRWKRRKFDAYELSVLGHSMRESAFPDATELSSLSVLLDVPFRTVRIWFQNQRQRGESMNSTKRRVPSLPTLTPHASGCSTYMALVAVLLAEEFPQWTPQQVAIASQQLSCPMVEGFEKFVQCSMNAFIARGVAKLMRGEPTLNQEDAASVAMFALLQKVADVKPN